MDISLNQLIDHLPDNSTLKTLLVSLGSEAENVDAAVELYSFVEAFYQAQKEHNKLPEAKKIEVVGSEAIQKLELLSDNLARRRSERALTFYLKYELSGISGNSGI
ncbi:MAG: hypothetical protein EA414_00985 [Arthrospira sp. PLM2.Bin9]|nr:hypothetical protein [Arthrospira sp. PLM2.Bin9]TVU55560.1 MAG: hypothetical protein EA414_00985 [Arthrospira sp. PLM2.Bin9]